MQCDCYFSDNYVFQFTCIIRTPAIGPILLVKIVRIIFEFLRYIYATFFLLLMFVARYVYIFAPFVECVMRVNHTMANVACFSVV